MSAFAIELGGLRQGASQVVLEAEAQALGLPADDWKEPVRGTFRVERHGDRISVRGEIRAQARLECVRCLTEFELPLTVPFELYADRAGTGGHRDEEALERDKYMAFHDGRDLRLGDTARETLLVEVPMAPRCRDDCRGLCPRCGADLNQGPCPCEAPATGLTAD